METANSIQDIINIAIGKNGGDLDITNSLDSINKKADDMAQFLESEIYDSMDHSLFYHDRIHIDHTDPVPVLTKKGNKASATFEFEIISRSYLDRLSLRKDHFISEYFGEAGIIKLLNDGYVIKDTEGARKVHGEWHGVRKGPLLKREGANFLDKFDGKYSNANTTIEILI